MYNWANGELITAEKLNQTGILIEPITVTIDYSDSLETCSIDMAYDDFYREYYNRVEILEGDFTIIHKVERIPCIVNYKEDGVLDQIQHGFIVQANQPEANTGMSFVLVVGLSTMAEGYGITENIVQAYEFYKHQNEDVITYYNPGANENI